jgi:hypothetical protein
MRYKYKGLRLKIVVFLNNLIFFLIKFITFCIVKLSNPRIERHKKNIIKRLLNIEKTNGFLLKNIYKNNIVYIL